MGLVKVVIHDVPEDAAGGIRAKVMGMMALGQGYAWMPGRVTVESDASPDSLRLDPEDPASVERLARALRRVDPMVDDPRGQLFYVPTGLNYSQSIREYAAAIAREWKCLPGCIACAALDRLEDPR